MPLFVNNQECVHPSYFYNDIITTGLSAKRDRRNTKQLVRILLTLLMWSLVIFILDQIKSLCIEFGTVGYIIPKNIITWLTMDYRSVLLVVAHPGRLLR